MTCGHRGCARPVARETSRRIRESLPDAGQFAHRPAKPQVNAPVKVCVWKLDRLGRSAKELLMIADDLRARGVGLRILTGSLARRDRGESPTAIARALGVSRASVYRHLA